MSDSLVDWGLAERVATSIAGGGETAPPPPILSADGLAATCSEAETRIREYARLEPVEALPAPEPLDRTEWVRAIMGTLQDFAAELERENTMDVSLPGPLGGIVRSLLRVAAGTEAGLAVGYAGRRILGQYDIALIGDQRPPRLMMVVPNLRATAAELDVELEPFVRWVALHETTHALQFTSAPWLREHLGDAIRRLLGGAAEGAGLGDLLRRIVREPRRAISSILRGELAAAVVGPQQAPLLERVQATMTVIEGHAEHVMDGAAGGFVDDVEGLRARVEAKRAARGPLETVAGRLLGLDLKLRQYELGKGFCDAVAARGGIEALNRVWEGPGTLPNLRELEHPAEWLQRTAAAETTL